MLSFLPDECCLLETYLHIGKNYFVILSENISAGWACKTKALNVDFIQRKGFKNPGQKAKTLNV